MKFTVLILFLTLLAAADPSPSRTCTLDQPLPSGQTRSLTTLRTVVLHHTARNSVGASVATLRERGLSYHYLIAPDGQLIVGVPLHKTALHAAGANRGSVGIAMVGADMQDWSPSEAQMTTVKRLLGTLVRNHPGMRYLIGHGDVRDTNHGEPFGIDFDRLVTELATEQHVRLRHPRLEEEPLRGYRLSATRLLARPLTPKHPIRPENLAAMENVSCSDGQKVIYSVPPVYRDSVPVDTHRAR
jgi:hypothetical protein